MALVNATDEPLMLDMYYNVRITVEITLMNSNLTVCVMLTFIELFVINNGPKSLDIM